MVDDHRIRLSTQPTSLRACKGFWLAGSAAALFILTLAIGNFFVSPDKAVSRKTAGHDFLPFYVAGTFVRNHQLDKLYDLDGTRSAEQILIHQNQLNLPDGAIGPYWNPPFFALLFVPLSALSYERAWTIWCFFNLAAVAGSIVLFCQMLPPKWQYRGLVPLLLLFSPPFIQATGHGQNTDLSLFILTAAITLWRKDRPILAGAIIGLVFYKPQLGAVIAAVMVLTLGWRALVGLVITGTSLLALTLLALPGTLADFLRRLPHNLTYLQIDHVYMWDRHVTLKAFWRLLFQGFATGKSSFPAESLYLLTAAALGIALLAVIWKLRQRGDSRSRDRIISATIVAMPLLMPFYFDYDLLLLSVPAVLVAAEAIEIGIPRRLLAAWVLLDAYVVFNPFVAGETRVNVSVVLLAALATMMIGAAWPAQKIELSATDEPLRQAA